MIKTCNIAILLHDKYIAFNSKLAINISYQTRKSIGLEMKKLRQYVDSNDVSKVDIEKLFGIFDFAIHHMLSLLRPVYSRFKHSDNF